MINLEESASLHEDESEYSLDDAIEHFGFGFYQLRLTFVVGLSWMADAMEMMVLSILAPILLCEWNLQKYQEALITTVVFVGIGFGSIFWGLVGDMYGRSKSLFASVVIVFLFGLGTSVSPNYVGILIMRFIVGFGVGGVPQAVTIATEILPKRNRGKSVVFLSFFWACGSVLAVVLAIASVNSMGWRWYLAFVTIPMLLFIVVGMFWLPESPRYLIVSNRYTDTLKLLKQIAKCNRRDLPSGNLRRVMHNIKRGNVFDLFSSSWRRTTVILLIIWFTSPFAYYGIVLLTTEVFQTKVNACNPHITNNTVLSKDCIKLTNKDYIDFMWTSFAEFPGIVVALILCETIGRRWSLVTLFGSSGIGFLFLSLCTTRTLNVVVLFAVRGLVTGAFQIAYVYTPEVLPTNVRGIGLGLCYMFSRLGAMSTPFVAQVLILKSFYSVLGVYSGVIIFCAMASFFLTIETKGKMLLNSTGFEIQIKRTEYSRL